MGSYGTLRAGNMFLKCHFSAIRGYNSSHHSTKQQKYDWSLPFPQNGMGSIHFGEQEPIISLQLVIRCVCVCMLKPRQELFWFFPILQEQTVLANFVRTPGCFSVMAVLCPSLLCVYVCMSVCVLGEYFGSQKSTTKPGIYDSSLIARYFVKRRTKMFWYTISSPTFFSSTF